MKTIIFTFLTLLGFSLCFSELPDGYYQVDSILVSQDGERFKNHNTTYLYLKADSQSIKIAGVYLGMLIKRELAIEQVVADTLFLRDRSNRGHLYKFRISGDTVSGRHSVSYYDGSRTVFDSRAILRKLTGAHLTTVKMIMGFLE